MDYRSLSTDTELAELLRYRLLIYPHPHILREKTAVLLTAYVEQGGTLVLLESMTDMENMREVCGRITLAPYGVKVYRLFQKAKDAEYG